MTTTAQADVITPKVFKLEELVEKIQNETEASKLVKVIKDKQESLEATSRTRINKNENISKKLEIDHLELLGQNEALQGKTTVHTELVKEYQSLSKQLDQLILTASKDKKTPTVISCSYCCAIFCFLWTILIVCLILYSEIDSQFGRKQFH